MEFHIEKQEDKTVASMKGRLDTVTSAELKAGLDENWTGADDLELDFTEVEYISSAGLRVLLSAQKTMFRQGSMKVINVNETILEIFEVTGFSDILTVE